MKRHPEGTGRKKRNKMDRRAPDVVAVVKKLKDGARGSPWIPAVGKRWWAMVVGGNRGMRQSIKEYIPAVGKRWWAMVAGGILATAGGVSLFCPFLVIPTLAWFLIALLFISVAQFLAFHRIREEKDGLKGQLSIIPTNGVVVIKPQLVIRILDVEFGLSGDSGYPLLNSDKARWIRLSLSFEWTGDVFIETLELVVSGKEPILAHEWRPGEVGYYYYFQIPDWVKSSERRSIQVQAFANGVKWGSPERSIKLPAL